LREVHKESFPYTPSRQANEAEVVRFALDRGPLWREIVGCLLAKLAGEYLWREYLQIRESATKFRSFGSMLVHQIEHEPGSRIRRLVPWG
jgi:hypothetical protein